ncbi:hypothetical protein ACHAW5_000782 [Stephanodiscus triporus]|uniref:Uncharacterized protein n=1 Tax=Stephanodiscus triporus TaxID=2934178 RepID=A0ABD3MSW5_9STRA
MASHQTIVVELGSSRIKVGFAGESKPRRVLNDDGGSGGGARRGGGGWTVAINDGMVSRACRWTSLHRYHSSMYDASRDDSAKSGGSASVPTTAYEWERTLYPLFSHALTSILFVQRPSRHRMLILTSDAFPPRIFREALHRVLLDYLGVGGVWLLNGGAFEGVYHLLEGLPPPPSLTSSAGPPRAHLIVDIGTHEARVAVCVAGSSILADTHRATLSGYDSFLGQVLTNYQGEKIVAKDAVDEECAHLEEEGSYYCPVTSLEDANAVVRAWIALSSSSAGFSPDITTVQVRLPSLERAQRTESSMEATIQLPVQPLLKAFHQIYLDYSNPSSLIFAMLTSVRTCPIDYRKAALQHALLLGGGSVALRHFCFWGGLASTGSSTNNGLGPQLETAARDACGVSSDDESAGESKGEEKKDDGASSVSSISRKRFRSLQGVVHGHVDDDDGRRGGINIQYPDPFAADMVAWIGGSIMGTLGYSKYYQNKFP